MKIKNMLKVNDFEKLMNEYVKMYVDDSKDNVDDSVIENSNCIDLVNDFCLMMKEIVKDEEGVYEMISKYKWIE